MSILRSSNARWRLHAENSSLPARGSRPRRPNRARVQHSKWLAGRRRRPGTGPTSFAVGIGAPHQVSGRTHYAALQKENLAGASLRSPCRLPRRRDSSPGRRALPGSRARIEQTKRRPQSRSQKELVARRQQPRGPDTRAPRQHEVQLSHALQVGRSPSIVVNEREKERVERQDPSARPTRR